MRGVDLTNGARRCAPTPVGIPLMCPCLPGIGSQHEHGETQLQSCTLRPTAPPPTPSGFTSASAAPQSAPAASRAPSNARQVARRSSSAAPARRSAAHPPRGALLRHRGRLSSSHPCRPTYLDCPPAAACQSADAQGPGLLHRQGPMHLHMQSWTVSWEPVLTHSGRAMQGFRSDTSSAWPPALANAAKHAPVIVQAAAAPVRCVVRRGAVRGKLERGGEVGVRVRVVPQVLCQSRGGLACGGSSWVCSARAGRQTVFGAAVTSTWELCMMSSSAIIITVWPSHHAQITKRCA